ncbi:Aldo/keto reductase [Obba rivulosa]|uniref:Aldo/keto reductase n=1 Tax=Obba rivulosa TaxID=1052685 RepID=A0A8E2DHW4_9APHY|nr:Aldo/keto reductase [Obba rivulosa]
MSATESMPETTELGPFIVPRIWTGLWQLSGNAWGSAPAAKIRFDMAKYVDQGFTAFDMADHYGSSEILFGQVRKTLPPAQIVVGATKWCVFKRIDPTWNVVENAINERLERMQTDCIDLLQFHWQHYEDHGYLTALRALLELRSQGKIRSIGLCNFDSVRTDEICTDLGDGAIISNQVQFSLIDTRPLHGLKHVCEKHGIKLLTYGTVCGGFLADEWLDRPEPDLYSGNLTPSQRKYLDMILKAWGDWQLFQSLLTVLRRIGDRHGGVSIANVATRWVLDHPFVGAVIIGARLGISDHTKDNLRVFTFALISEDLAAIDDILAKSNGSRMIFTIGDCGAEYR